MSAVPTPPPADGPPSTPEPPSVLLTISALPVKPALVSSLEIDVEHYGAFPRKQHPDPPSATQISRDPPPLPTRGRPSRKAKLDALMAINARSESPEIPSVQAPARGMVSVNAPSVAFSKRPESIQAPKLNMTNIKQANDPKPKSRGDGGIFGLEECPTFKPTEAEFREPMRYIGSIAPIGKQYGICKIIPPEAWQMPFVTDTESFRFMTRLQRLNSVEATARDRINFMIKLNQFHKQQGDDRVTVPTISHRPLDLFEFRKEVHSRGGYEGVIKDRAWAEVARKLGYGQGGVLSTQLKQAYQRIILPYDKFEEHVRNSPAQSPLTPRKKGGAHFDTPSSLVGRKARLPRMSVSRTPLRPTRSASSGLATPVPQPGFSSPLSEPPEGFEFEEDPSRNSRKENKVLDGGGEDIGMTDLMPPFAQSQREERAQSPDIRLEPLQPGDACEICRIDNDNTNMLLCDGCDAAFHMYCLDPPLTYIPKSQWFCHACLFGTGGDYGFDEGQEHSLESFHMRDVEFSKKWFDAHPPSAADQEQMNEGARVIGDGLQKVTERAVEREFWRLVESRTETVEVEYGADVHSTIHGSASPTVETHPLNPYSRDGWNLNNLPILPDSLLRYIKSDISGMTVPWTYVGMLFSTFCWHNEDHYTYSINFMHWGETKTWYGIPSDHADKFENAIRNAAPDLFETQPDLLFHLVTMISPERLKKSGVRVSQCLQRAGEFVITFPQAYHSGFNHGFNLNEAVNFALPDWLPRDLAAVHRYRNYLKPPVFSHDELLITITQYFMNVKSSIWLEIPVKEMYLREMGLRQKLRVEYPEIDQVVDDNDRPEEEYQCHHCHAFCFLAQVICSCTSNVACLDHANKLCSCEPGKKSLRMRFADDELTTLLNKICERAAAPTAWRQKFHKTLAASSRPPLKSLRTLVTEGERFSSELPELITLKRCVERANRWVEEASAFTTRRFHARKQKLRTTRRSALEEKGAGTPPPDNETLKGVEEIERLIREYDTLGVQSDDFPVLVDVREQAMNFAANAQAVLLHTSEDENLVECEALLAQGSSLNVRLKEYGLLDKRVKRVNFMSEVATFDSRVLSLEDITNYVNRASACDIPQTHPILRELQSQKAAGEVWKARALQCVEAPVISLAELESALARPAWIPIDSALLTKMENLRNKTAILEDQARIVLTHIPMNHDSLPTVGDMRKFLLKAEGISSTHLDLLRAIVDQALDLEASFELLLTEPHVGFDSVKPLRSMDQLRRTCDYAEEHLCNHMRLPWVERMTAELDEHESWLEENPAWLRTGQQRPRNMRNEILEMLRYYKRSIPRECSCICLERSSPKGPMMLPTMKCHNCQAKIHVECKMTSCPFCDPGNWTPEYLNHLREQLRKPTPFYELVHITNRAPTLTRKFWRDYEDMKKIIVNLQNFLDEVDLFLQGQHNYEDIYRIRCYMRAIYFLYVDWVAPDSDELPPQQRLSVLYRRLVEEHKDLLRSPQPARRPRRRDPEFFFREDDIFCLCAHEDLNHPTITCPRCDKVYHREHVGMGAETPDNWRCLLCCVRAGKDYHNTVVSVIMGQLASPVYLDYKETIKQGKGPILLDKDPNLGDANGHYHLQCTRLVEGKPLEGAASQMPPHMHYPMPMLPMPYHGPAPYIDPVMDRPTKKRRMDLPDVPHHAQGMPFMRSMPISLPTLPLGRQKDGGDRAGGPWIQGKPADMRPSGRTPPEYMRHSGLPRPEPPSASAR
ncbi:hypothetical protein DACRYDRAFT_60996 [Dacryopinax primogenitus]|uniref:Uncharacterized protein n=1 Tax=Dacryopinax primogenitus (strain DJM 731) TaxID=1858805 RepID=M5GBI1_DACPD|nr:uncharacterized protein DACRYDRAFT_60996 [Dacryopinax primogenitus]EJU06319.1 hypothetical protein DACRYDRAFT_60996 [Dacryopinax primogenitus]